MLWFLKMGVISDSKVDLVSTKLKNKKLPILFVYPGNKKVKMVFSRKSNF